VVDTLEILCGAPLDEDKYFKVATLGRSVELIISWFRPSLVANPVVQVTSSGEHCQLSPWNPQSMYFSKAFPIGSLLS